MLFTHQRSTSIGGLVTISERIYRRLIAAQWAALVGVVCGAFVFPPALDLWRASQHAEAEAHQRRTPVVSMSGTLIERTDDTALIHIAGTKHRECRYLGLQAYSVDRNGVQHDANVQRVGMKERGDTKAPGAYDIGIWRVWPLVRGASSVVIRAQHDCEGVVVSTVIANVGV